MTWMGWQLDYLLLLQNFRNITNGIFDNFFLFISQIGIAPFTLIAICAIYWGFNKKLGTYMIYCSCFSYLINIFLKFTFCIYRPWILDNRILPTQQALNTAPGYSFPSGHTAGAMSFWGSIAMYFRNIKWVVYTCLIIIFLVMLSRNYLCVHTSQDVIVSFIVGICILIFVEKFLCWINEKKSREIISISVIAIVCAALCIYLTLKSYPTDYINGEIVYDGTSAKQGAIFRILNTFAIFFGCFLENRFIKFEAIKGNIIIKLLLISLGITVLFLLEKSVALYYPARYIVCILTGLFITFIYPCFISFVNKKILHV